jgi:hypothetical protein
LGALAEAVPFCGAHRTKSGGKRENLDRLVQIIPLPCPASSTLTRFRALF